MKTFDALKEFYENYDEDNRLTSRYGSVEYLTTMRYIEKYLRPGMRVLEIGAGTGRYSHALARQGYRVDAVELLTHNIEIFKANTQSGENITITQGNATDLSVFADDTYDLTLLLGPMYHLFTEEEKLAALGEAVRVTKKGGIVFAAYCGNDATILQFCFLRGMLKNEHYKALVDPVTFKAASDPIDLFVLHRPEEIAALRGHFAVTPLHFAASDGYANYMRDTLLEMDEELFETYLRYHFATCERADMLGYSNHYLDIFRKEQ
ncbi:MAG: class I SAM-dependent methyltransferase [Oscillospiraceae bacterium]|nr:class I SAM-dependent methyltransferase [Oscillospiraceae bacterium]